MRVSSLRFSIYRQDMRKKTAGIKQQDSENTNKHPSGKNSGIHIELDPDRAVIRARDIRQYHG
jgi:hypothetical protein